MSDTGAMRDATDLGERATQPNDATGGDTSARDTSEAPAQRRGAPQEARVVACPYCHAQDVELLALFGAQLLTDQYYCNACHTPFEHVRDG